jgi:hypothetical protein
MAPISQRKHLGRDKFGAQFGLLKTQQYTDPASRTVTPTMYVLYLFDHPSSLSLVELARCDATT